MVPAFQDVPATYWAHNAIETIAAKGIISGFPDGTFQPDAPVTRAQFVKMLVLTLGLKAGVGSTPFTDVSPTEWCAPYVATALQAGIVEGMTPSRFGPDQPLTREQMAVLIARALHLTQTATLHFADAGRIGTWALPSVEAVVAGGYMSGFPNGTFQPTRVTTGPRWRRSWHGTWRTARSRSGLDVGRVLLEGALPDYPGGGHVVVYASGKASGPNLGTCDNTVSCCRLCNHFG